MVRAMVGVSLVIFTSCGLFGQSVEAPPEFEVASVKAAPPPTGNLIRTMMRGGPGNGDPGQLNYSNVTLKNILMNAYDVKSYQISGPAWLDSERYDIVAKIPPGTSKEQFRLMLQTLLAQRFKLTLHHEKKELPMYALVVGKNGPKMKESVEDPAGAAADGAPPPPLPPDGPPKITMGKDGFPQPPPGAAGRGTFMMMMNGRAKMTANKQSMSGLAGMLANQMDRPIVDMTGLTGNYDFTLTFEPENRMGPMGPGRGGMEHGPGEGGAAPLPSATEESVPTIAVALQEQLGLKLEARKGPVDLLVIDRVEKVPTEN